MGHAVRFAGKQRKHCKLPRIFSKCKCFAIIHRVQKGIIAILSVCLKKVESWLLPKFQAHLFCSWKKKLIFWYFTFGTVWPSCYSQVCSCAPKMNFFVKKLVAILSRPNISWSSYIHWNFPFHHAGQMTYHFLFSIPFSEDSYLVELEALLEIFWILKLMWKLLFFFKVIRSLFITAKVTPI